jgi:hypothetical protein
VRGGELPEDGWTKDEEKSLDLAVKKFAEPVSPDFTSLPVGGVSRIVTSLAVRARLPFECFISGAFRSLSLAFNFWNLFLEPFRFATSAGVANGGGGADEPEGRREHNHDCGCAAEQVLQDARLRQGIFKLSSDDRFFEPFHARCVTN